MTSTAAKLINETLGHLQSFTGDASQLTTLATSIDADDLTFMVSPLQDGAMGLTAGAVEIDSELIFVQSVDADGNVVVPAWGRGHNGTTATTHAAFSRVTSAPVFPRQRVLDALNETVLRLFPKLFVPKVATATTTVPQNTYDLPEDAQWVVDARWLIPDASRRWIGVKRLRMSRGGYGQPGDLGVSVDVGDYTFPGQPIEFTYAAAPTAMSLESDVYAAVTGLPERTKDLVVLGAVLALLPAQELSRLQITTAEQQDRNRLVAPGSALQSARYLEQRFALRLSEEVASLRRSYPVRVMGSYV